jgi:hypothetical protein
LISPAKSVLGESFRELVVGALYDAEEAAVDAERSHVEVKSSP